MIGKTHPVTGGGGGCGFGGSYYDAGYYYYYYYCNSHFELVLLGDQYHVAGTELNDLKGTGGLYPAKYLLESHFLLMEK